MCPILLSARPFCWEVPTYEDSCSLPSVLKYVWIVEFINSLPLLVLNRLMFTSNWVWIVLPNWIMRAGISAFDLMSYNHVKWLKLSTNIKKHLFPPILGIEQGPHTSLCTQSKERKHLIFNALKGDRLYLANWQALHDSVLTSISLNILRK